MPTRKQKKLLLLGGLRYLIPVIKSAHELGIYVITCDYRPDNIAHKYSDEFHNISIIDKEAVLKLAKELEIDGIMSFAVDPGVLTAAYVCDKLGLPSSGSYESIKTLQNKALFRKFLCDNNFNVPKAKGYTKIENGLKDITYFNWPVIVKPTDSAGSKGVTKVSNPIELEKSIKNALYYSPSKQFIIEEFIEQIGFASDSDCFSVNGKLVYFTLSNQRFDINAVNPYTPAAFSWPSTMSKNHQDELKNEIQRLLTLLNMKTSIYNIEARIGKDYKPYIMEVSPRGGGNRLAEMLHYATGFNLIKNSVLAAVGKKIDNIVSPKYIDYWGECILHSNKDCNFQRIEINKAIQNYIYEIDLWVNKGDYIKTFTGANETIGTIVINCDNKNKLEEIITNCKKWMKVVVN